MGFLFEIIALGLNNLRLHFLRSVLTALGIILGVAAVITMAAIGNGRTAEAITRIERLGAKNIIIRSVKPPDAAPAQGASQSWEAAYGITWNDLRSIQTQFDHADTIVPLKAVGNQVVRGQLRQTSQAFGTVPDFLRVSKLSVLRGRYLNAEDDEDFAAVAVIGAEVAQKMFPDVDPLESTIRIDDHVFNVVGVLRPVGVSGGAGATRVGRDLNKDVHIPISTASSRFGDTIFRQTGGNRSVERVAIQELYFESAERDDVPTDAAMLRRLLDHRHPNLRGIEMVVPYELLEDARREALTGNIVTAAIAGIALLVGGIGIMNIMLASVTERTREIGIRRALGATRAHIVWQFLVETGVLSAIGGLIGIALGVGLALLIDYAVPHLPAVPVIGPHINPDATLPTLLSAEPILISFSVATATGLVFGIYPARVAARQDPIVALRHD